MLGDNVGMNDQNSLWRKLDPKYTVTEEVLYSVNGRRVVSSRDLIRAWGVSAPTLNRYVMDGMPKHPCSLPNFSVFDLAKAGAWRDANVQIRGVHPQIPREQATSEDGESPSEVGAAIRKIIADANRAEEQALSEALKRKQLEGSLIEADTLDIAQAEMAVIYNALYQNDKKTFPVQLFGKTSGEIREYLDDHYANRMEDLHSLIDKEFIGCDETLFDIVHIVLKQLKNGVPPDVITFALQGE